MSFYLFIVISFYLNIAHKNIVCDVGLIRLKKQILQSFILKKWGRGLMSVLRDCHGLTSNTIRERNKEKVIKGENKETKAWKILKNVIYKRGFFAQNNLDEIIPQ